MKIESDTVYDLGVSKSGMFEFKLDVKRGITIPKANKDRPIGCKTSWTQFFSMREQNVVKR